MNGRTHAVFGAASGLVVGTVVGAAVKDQRAGVVVLALSALFATGPDVDHKPAPVGRRWPLVRWMVNLLSWVFGLDKHRGITHTAVFTVVVGALAFWGMTAVGAPTDRAAVVGVGVATGWASHLAGDWVTRSSLPDVWWPFAREADGPPRWMRFYSGGRFERWIVYPLCLVGLLGSVYLMLLTM